MATGPNSKPSFSSYRKWTMGLRVFFIVLLVLSVVVMVNYISHDFFLRLHLSTRTRNQLSPLTVKLLQSLTNRVRVVIYYNKNEGLYSTVSSLLDEYKLVNPKFSVETVDYLRDPGGAQKVKADYKLASAVDKNLVIFECEGKVLVVDGKALANWTLEQVPNEKELEFRNKPIAFAGEKMFTSALLAVTNPKPLNAYFLQGHGEHRLDGGDPVSGYLKFQAVLQQNYIRVQPTSLLGTNPVPLDCNLLIVAGPTTAIPALELVKIQQYLNQGGRLFALFNAQSLKKETGLEAILAKWGVAVGSVIIKDPDHSPNQKGSDLVVSAFSKHPLVNPLLGSGLYLIRPRPVGKLSSRSPAADAPHIEPVAFSGEKASIEDDPSPTPHQFSFIVAVEKGAVKGVVTERGATRMVVAGDSFFLDDGNIDLLANRDFVGYAVNWLLDRTQLLEELGPRPITEYRLVMTKSQLQTAQWILLAGMPGAVLLFGGLVWLCRRR